MSAILKYAMFIIILAAVVYTSAGLDLPFASPAGEGQAAMSAAPFLPEKPSYQLSGVHPVPQKATYVSAWYGAIDYSVENDIVAAGGTGAVMLWQLPDERPVFKIDSDDGLQALQVRFLKGKDVIAVSGRNADGRGSIRMFAVPSGKPILRIDDPEPVLFMDFHPGMRYLLATGVSYIKIWDLKDKGVVSVMPKNRPEARGVFFMEGRYVLQSDSLSLYDWAERKKAGVLDIAGPVVFKKVHDNLYAWFSGNAVSMLHTPHGKKEMVPLNTKGIYAFDIAPDGKWGLFLRDNQTMSVIDCATGAIVKTAKLSSLPAGVFISPDGAGAYLLYGSGNIDVFEIGSKNTFRNIRFQAVKLFNTVKEKISQIGSGQRGV